ncbi:MAG: hypothetical protein QM820_64195 [Minicystis sp.]
MHLRPSFAFALVSLLAACSSSSPETSGTGGGGGSGGSGTGTSTQHYSLQFTTKSGQETHWCQYARMPEGDGKEVVVTGYDWTWENMHHWALYRTTADLPANVSFDEPFDCFAPGAMEHAGPASLALGGTATGTLDFPSGTGFTFKPGEVVIFQAHTVNTSASDVTAKFEVDVKSARAADVPNRLGLIQFYDPYIVVPAHTEATAQMRCKIPQDITVVQGTTHEHTRGIGVQVFLDAPDGTRADKPFLESKDWEHPSVSNELMKIAAGSHVRTRCSYLGDESDVIQGQDKIDNEMCMFIGYYYPVVQDGGLFENCVQDSVPGGVGDEFGTGSRTCTESLNCIQACPPGDAPNPGDGRIDVGKCWQKCLVDSCPAASGPLNKLTGCVGAQCAEACSGGDCAACVVSKCGAEYGACSTSTCP